MSRLRKLARLLVAGMALVWIAGGARSPHTASAQEGTAEREDLALSELAEQLEERAQALERRESEIEDEAELLRELEDRLEERLTEIERAKEELSELVEAVDAQESAEIQRLTRLVEAMRAGEGAAVVAELEPELAVAVLRGMNRAKAGKLLAKMPPRLAADRAELLARGGS